MRKLLVLIIISAIVLLYIDSNPVEAAFTPVIPAYKVQKLPTIQDFVSKTQSELLGDFVPYTILRDNGEKIQSYLLSSGASKEFIMIFYFEDKTDKRLENYVPFNSDYFVMGFSAKEDTEPQYIYAERKGRGCIIPIGKINEFWTGTFTGCEGGAAEVKQTENGWAVYVKFFGTMEPPTKQKPFLIFYEYGDIKKSKGGVLEELKSYTWPDVFNYGRIIPITDKKADILKVNSGSLGVSDFIYKPSKFLTQDLEKNEFDCADNTVTASSKKVNYGVSNDPIQIEVTINSDLSYGQVYLKIFDSDKDIVYQEQQGLSNTKTVLFHFSLTEGIGVYTAEAEFGIDGPKDKTTFAIGDAQVSDVKNQCYVYLLYNDSTQNLIVVAHLEDATHSPYDQIQIFVDRKGDSKTSLNADDVSFVVNKNDFGSHKFVNNEGWNLQDYEKIEGRIMTQGDSYDVFIPVSGVTKDFKFAIEQIDHTGLEIKSTRVPENGFSTLPNNWSNTISSGVQKKWMADKWKPDEILVKQNLDINLIIVGDDWNPKLQDKIRQKLAKSYKPIIAQELTRAGIEYNYNYNFISTSDELDKKVIDFMNAKSEPKRPFYGEDDIKEPWGFGPWIQKNHTEWIGIDKTYKVEYRLIDAEQMETFLYETIIQNDPKLSKQNSANLIFISADMNDVNFLHNYKIKKPDSVNKNPHQAVGLMGYGANYNFYFFDLYAVPWEKTFGIDLLYDKSLNNYATSLHDVKTDDRYVALISDHINNATSLLITPSYVYDPVYKENYILDLVLVADPKVGTGTVQVLEEYFVNTKKIETQLEELTPYSNWKINLQADNIKSPNIPSSLKNAINKKTTIERFEGFPEFGTIDILYVENLKKAAAEWATTRESSQFKDFKNSKESSWVIPTIVVVSDLYNEIALFDKGSGFASGIAPSHPADSNQPCCVFGVTTDDRVWNKKISVTDLVLHEVGHVLGFMHPFMGYDVEDEFFVNSYFEKWYGSVMAYNAPQTYGCGFWHGYYVGGSCGIADTTFTKFDKENHARGVTANLIEAAESNIYRTMLEFEKNGQDLNKLPESTRKVIDNVESKLNKAKAAFSSNQIFSENGAYKIALDAAIDSTKLVKESTLAYETQIEPVKISIPKWIKDNIEWWSTGSISEKEFVGALQYLIKEKIIMLPDVPKSGSAVGKAVPEWVKNNAIWWSQDKISDNEFVSGLQFLIKEGIIIVN